MDKIVIKSNSVLAILDKILREMGLQPKYRLEEYLDVDNGRIRRGLILYCVEVEGVSEEDILGFVNGEEPGAGTVPLHEVVPMEGDVLSILSIKQGVYKGDFKVKGVKAGGVKPIIVSYLVAKKDILERSYVIPLQVPEVVTS